MDKGRGASLLLLLLLLLLCPGGGSEFQSSCPYRCQCFTPSQVLCADERMMHLPSNMSKQVTDFIVMTSAVSQLRPRALWESPQLTKLVLLNNVLRSVDSQALDDLMALRELEISGNPWLEHLPLGTFSNQTNLTKLLLNFNRLAALLPGLFDSLKELETLQMKGNFLSRLPPSLFLNLQNLKVLDLSQNKLDGVTRETFSGLERLEVLEMSDNLIGNLTSDAFNNTCELTELHLEGNRISELPEGVFSALTKLHVLNLRGNLLATFGDDAFGSKAVNLKELNLKGNRLTQLSSLSRFTSLTDIILSSNQFSSLPEDIFRNNSMLENLDLSENRLTFLPERLFSDLFGVKAIDLHKNNLSTVPPKLFADQMLIQQLYLSDNRLETLPPGLLDVFITQNMLRLHGNPWKCDCHMSYLHDWVLANAQNIEMLDLVLCESPGYFKKRAVASVDRDQLVCRLSAEEMPDLSSCSLQASNDTVVVKCKVDRCSPLSVKVQFQEDGGDTKEHIVKREPQHSRCGNDTRIESPVL